MFKVYVSNGALASRELTRTATFDEAKAYVAENFEIIYGEDDDDNVECADFFVKYAKGGTDIICVEPVGFRAGGA